MDEYISQLLAEVPESTLHDVAQNIKDEPIHEGVKKGLLKPLLPRKPRPSPAPRPSIKAKEKKRKAIVREFDPNFPSKALRTTADHQQEILNLFDVASNKNTDGIAFRQTPWAIGSFLRGLRMDVPKGHLLRADPKAFLEGLRPQINDNLEEEIRALNGIKFQLALKVQLRKTGPDGTEEYTGPVFRHKQEVILQPSEIDETLDKATPNILELLGKWTQRGSGWVADQVESLWLDIARYQPLRGGSYIPLPVEVKTKKIAINVQNKKYHCLRWALRSALNPAAHHVDRPSQYPTLDNLNFEATDAPIPVSQILKVEKQNNCAFNVFGWETGIIAHHLSKQPANMVCINLC